MLSAFNEYQQQSEDAEHMALRHSTPNIIVQHQAITELQVRIR
jgi:hypothetical protein